MPASLLKQAEYTDLRLQLRDYSITLDRLVEASGISKATITRILDPQRVGGCRYSSVMAVRAAIAKLAPSFMTYDFTEYDNQFGFVGGVANAS